MKKSIILLFVVLVLIFAPSFNFIRASTNVTRTVSYTYDPNATYVCAAAGLSCLSFVDSNGKAMDCSTRASGIAICGSSLGGTVRFVYYADDPSATYACATAGLSCLTFYASSGKQVSCSTKASGYAICGPALNGTIRTVHYVADTGNWICAETGLACLTFYSVYGGEVNCSTKSMGVVLCGDLSSVPCNTFTYSDWGTCSSLGVQTHMVATSLPSGCTGGTPVLTQPCTYVPLVNTCTSFDYSIWGDCSSSGTQTHYVTASYPSGCTGGTPVLTQPCTYVPLVNTCTSFDYSIWGDCSSSGTQIRAVTASYPSGCTGGSPSLTQSCTPTTTITTCNSFTYSDWASCNSFGYQARTVTYSYPSNCTGGDPVITQNCTPITTTNTCSAFTYSDWGTCSSGGVKNRTVTYSYPSNCTGGYPVLTQSCTAPVTTQDNSALIAQLQAQIASLMVQIRVMQAQQGITAWCYTFNSNLGYANSGLAEVSYLHTVLGKEGITYSPDTVNVYGEATMGGVIQFQQKYSIAPLSGYVGPLTRAKINLLYGCVQ